MGRFPRQTKHRDRKHSQPASTQGATHAGAFAQPVKNLGWTVTLAAMGINLALGILYTWSVFSKAITKQMEWTEAQSAWPYAVACLTFAFLMVPAGRLQDKMGPRLAASIGGLLVGAGMILASITSTYWGYLVGFGLLTGAGIGFGYAAATPPAVKWFPPARTGMIAGIVVSGFGLASVYAAPLTNWLIASYGIPTTMMILGIAFMIVVVGLAQLLAPPPKGYVVQPGAAKRRRRLAQAGLRRGGDVRRPGSSPLLWFMYACGSGAGLMIISKLAKHRRTGGREPGIPARGGPGDRQRWRPNRCRLDLRQAGQAADDAHLLPLSGRPHGVAHPGPCRVRSWRRSARWPSSPP